MSLCAVYIRSVTKQAKSVWLVWDRREITVALRLAELPELSGTSLEIHATESRE